MAKIIYVDPGVLGHDSNTGLHPRRPKKSLAGLAVLGLSPKDEVLLRYGTLFEESLRVKTNGVRYGTYQTGTENAHPPMISVPDMGIAVMGQGNAFDDLDVWHALTSILVDNGMEGNQFRRVRAQEFGYGYLIKGSHTTVIDPYVARGRMVRNTGRKTDVGPSAFTLWKEVGYENIGAVIRGALVEDAWADALAFKDGDGSIVEIWGGVKKATISDLEGHGNTVLVAIGGDKTRGETCSDILFERCVTTGSGGKVMFVNSPDEPFYVNWERVRFKKCSLIADEFDESPFFFAGNHGDMSNRLSIEDSVIVGTSQLFNAGKGTNLESIQRARNIYWRTDGSNNVGLKLNATETFADPQFHNVPGHDYRLGASHISDGKIGALGRAPRPSEVVSMKGPVRAGTTAFANSTVGGSMSVPYYRDMTAIDERYRVPGMRCFVQKHRLLYELQEDRNTWLKVRQITPKE